MYILAIEHKIVLKDFLWISIARSVASKYSLETNLVTSIFNTSILGSILGLKLKKLTGNVRFYVVYFLRAFRH